MRIRLSMWLLVCGSLLSLAEPGLGQNRWQMVQDRGEFIWGADQEGGGPYVFPDDLDPDNPDKLQGFEVELANELAAELSALAKKPIKARFQQGQWDNIPSMLGNTIDVALNGFELTPARQRDFRCTRPYYIYGLQLMGQFDEGLNSWNDLKQEGITWKIGVLGGSAAELYLEQPEWKPYVDIIAYQGTTEGLKQAETLSRNLTLLDDCAAIYYADRFPGLKFIGRPVGQGSYVMLVGKDEEVWQGILNQALTHIIADGRLQKIYDRWEMSGKAQVLAMRDKEVAAAQRRLNDRDARAVGLGYSRNELAGVAQSGADDGVLGLRLDAVGDFDWNLGRHRAVVWAELAALAIGGLCRIDTRHAADVAVVCDLFHRAAVEPGHVSRARVWHQPDCRCHHGLGNQLLGL